MMLKQLLKQLLDSKLVQIILIALAVFAICWIANVDVTLSAGKSGIHFSVEKGSK